MMLRAVAGIALLALGKAARAWAAGDARRPNPPGASDRNAPPPPDTRERAVTVRCRWCGSLNPEAAATCGECGGNL